MRGVYGKLLCLRKIMIKVLIVEDNLVYIKKILNSIINKIDIIHIKHIATNIKEALEIIYNNEIDLIILDLKLPDGNGLDLLKKIKSLNNIKKINIIILSDYKELVTNEYKDCNIINTIGKLEKEERTNNNQLKITPKYVISKILTEISNNFNYYDIK